jgi:hypothetical protein
VRVNAFSAVLAERAWARAAALDADPARRQRPLASVPFAAINLYDIAGLPTLAGAKIARGAPPACEDALLICRLEAAGAIAVGALNMDEYAYGLTTENSQGGACHSPHDFARTEGGSSGGSAAAVAAGQVPLSLGSDTNGSIRVPASLCGCFALKPTFGRLPRSGTCPFVASYDCLGPFARSARDLALAYDLIQGHAAADPGCVQRPLEPTVPAHDALDTHTLRRGVPGGWWHAMADAHARAAAFLITNAEDANLHLSELRSRAADFEPLARDRVLAGALLPAAWIPQVHRVRLWFARQVAAVLAADDVRACHPPRGAVARHRVAGARRPAVVGASEPRLAGATDLLHRPAGRHGAGVVASGAGDGAAARGTGHRRAVAGRSCAGGSRSVGARCRTSDAGRRAGVKYPGEVPAGSGPLSSLYRARVRARQPRAGHYCRRYAVIGHVGIRQEMTWSKSTTWGGRLPAT